MGGFLPDNASGFGGQVDWVMVLITVIGGWLVAVEAVLLTFTFRYRAREGVRAAYLPADAWRPLARVLVPAGALLLFDLAIDGSSRTASRGEGSGVGSRSPARGPSRLPAPSYAESATGR